MTAKRTSIAVMPFRNLSDESDTKYFADGFVEDLTAELTRFGSLRVLATECTFALDQRGQQKLIGVLAFASLSAARRLARHYGSHLSQHGDPAKLSVPQEPLSLSWGKTSHSYQEPRNNRRQSARSSAAD